MARKVENWVRVLHGMHRLTRRQLQVVAGWAAGKSLKEIALDLGVSNKTVEYHWAVARRAVGISSPVGMVHWALAAGLVKNQFT